MAKRELRISAAIKLPDDEFAAAEMLVKHKPAIDALREALGVTVTAEVVNARGPATKKGKGGATIREVA